MAHLEEAFTGAFSQPQREMNLSNASQRRLAGMIHEAGGWLSFECFMAAALYHPESGYYSSRIRSVGARGDFTTAPQQSPILGKALARWAKTQRRRLSLPRKWHVIEVGGGTGQLAETLLRSLGFFGRIGLSYHLVEISRTLRVKQQETLKRFPVSWHDTVAEALAAADGEALLLSNELVDAFPCRRLNWIEGKWHELGLGISEGKVCEINRALYETECDALHSTAVLSRGDPTVRSVEVHASYRLELEKIAASLKRGIILTIDYGDRFPQVYHRQPAGTVRGYVHHLRQDGAELYERIGQQDITADVNFSDLEKWGSDLGWAAESFATQREFIAGQLGSFSPANTTDCRLMDPIGAGSAFKVLQQSFGLPD